MKRTTYPVVCPYCGFQNTIRSLSPTKTERTLVLCDCDAGGCDQYFAVFARTRVEVDTVPLAKGVEYFTDHIEC